MKKEVALISKENDDFKATIYKKNKELEMSTQDYVNNDRDRFEKLVIENKKLFEDSELLKN